MGNRERITCEVRAISPELAQHILNEQPKNRARRKITATRYAQSMKRGEWVLGQPLIFDEDGKLMDGQHRLWGVILADRTIRFIVLSGVPRPVVFGTFDTGLLRGLADYLGIAGVEGEKLVASALRLLYCIDHKQLRPGMHDFHNIRPTPSYNELIEFAVRREEELTRAMKAVPPSIGKVFNRGYSIALCTVFARHDATMAEAFFHDLAAGSGLPASDPVLYLREHLLKDKASHKKSPPLVKIAAVIKTWNAVAAGVRVHSAPQAAAILRHRITAKQGALKPSLDHFPSAQAPLGRGSALGESNRASC